MLKRPRSMYVHLFILYFNKITLMTNGAMGHSAGANSCQKGNYGSLYTYTLTAVLYQNQYIIGRRRRKWMLDSKVYWLIAKKEVQKNHKLSYTFHAWSIFAWRQHLVSVSEPHSQTLWAVMRHNFFSKLWKSGSQSNAVQQCANTDSTLTYGVAAGCETVFI